MSAAWLIPKEEPISLRVEDVLLRGLKRYDEIQRIREVFYDPRLVLSPTSKPGNGQMRTPSSKGDS